MTASLDDGTHAPSLCETTAGDESTAPQGGTVRAPQRGDVIGRYVVFSQLGDGAMGIVLAAYDPELDRKVALKLLKIRRGDPATARARMQREAQALAKLSHPNVVAVHDVGVHDDRVFVAMEFVAGSTLTAWCAVRRPWRAVVEVFEAAGRGLAAAHERGLVHRDFKPDNVMLGEDGRVRVMDFGLASEAATQDATAARGGALIGTPRYMAPEQFAGGEVTAQSDQFAFCVALFEALYGLRPFRGDSVASLAFAVTQGKPVDPPRGSKVPRWLQRALRRGLATEPTDRFPTMHALLRELASRDARRRRRIVLAAVGGIAAATTAIVGGQALDEGRRMASCRAQGDAIAEVWNDDARAAVRQALVATALPYAQATADRVMPWLDRASEDWRETRTTACVRAEVRSEWDANDLDRSLWCLDERRLAFGALVAELQDAKHETVVAAVASAAGLPRVAPCLDEALLQRLPAPPADGRDAIEAVRVELSRVDALQATASYESGLALARASLVRAEELAWPPLVASARRRVGLLQQSTGAYDETERSLEQAYFEAAHADAIDDVFENAVTLTQLVGWQLRRQRDGERWWNLAEVARRQLPDDSGLLASKSLNAHALVDLSAGAYEQAAARFEEAIALGEAALGPNHPEVATTLTNLAVVYHNMGSYDEAVALYRRATEIWEIALGPEHPNVAINHNNLAASLLAKGDYDGAAVHFEHALEINIRALGPEHPDVATAWNNLGAVYHERRMYDEAEEHFEHALRIRERALGPDHPDVASTLGNLAVIRRARGQYREAAELNERALRIQEKALGPDHPDVGTTLLNLGLVLERTGDLERAKQLHERGLRILQRALGPDHASIAGSLTSLATVEHALGNDEEAARLLARARAIYERALGPDHLDLAHALVRSAIVALALEQPRDAIAWAERATEIYGAKQASARDVAEARFVLAKALLAGGERARAIALAEQVRDAYRAMGDDRADERAEVDEWLAGR